jgi:hypothetical protein
MMTIVVRDDPVCPICGATDGSVRAFKVGDEIGWWSECVAGVDHGVAVLGGKEEIRVPERLWFCEDWIEIPGKGRVRIER